MIQCVKIVVIRNGEMKKMNSHHITDLVLILLLPVIAIAAVLVLILDRPPQILEDSVEEILAVEDQEGVGKK